MNPPRRSSGQADLRRLRAYKARLLLAQRTRLRELRAVIRSAAPKAVDAFSYGIPAFRLDGRILIWCAVWKDHCGVYPMTPEVRRAAEQRGFETSKGTLRCPHDRPLPRSLIRRLVKTRAAAIRKKS